MRGHDLSSRRVRDRAWFGLILAAAFAAAVDDPDTARGGEAAGAEPPATLFSPRAREPIDLAARRVIVWEQGGDQWVLLSGRAAILQGAEGLRADEAVVRVTPLPGRTGTMYRLDVYAEIVEGGNAAGVAPTRRAARDTMTTLEQVRMRPYDPNGASRRDGPPRNSTILARSGLMNRLVETAQTRTAQKPAPSQPSLQPSASPRARILTVDAGPQPAQPPRGDRVGASAPVSADAPPIVVLPDLEPTPDAEGAVPPSKKDTPASVAATPAQLPDVVVVPSAKVDPAVRPSQYVGTQMEGADDPTGVGNEGLPPLVEAPELDSAPTVPSLAPGTESEPVQDEPPTELVPLPAPGAEAELPTELAPLPAPGSETVEAPTEAPTPAGPRGARTRRPQAPIAPILANTLRVTRVYPRSSSPIEAHRLPVVNGVDTVVIRGGVNIVTEAPQFGIIDVSADSAIIWRRVDEKGRSFARGPNGEQIEDAKRPMELYLEGNVTVRQDERKVAGNGDQKTYRARAVYLDLLSERSIVLDAELEMFAPGLIAPARVVSPRIEQYRPLVPGLNGRYTLGHPTIRADQTMTTGSRFPNPGYRFNSRSIDVFRVQTNLTDPNSGRTVGDKEDPNSPQDLVWRIDARQNVFRLGPVPIFYWPRFVADADDLEPPLRQITFRTNNYFGQQLLTDWNGFRLIGLKKPNFIDMWNVDLDYLSYRTKNFPALGSEIGWFGGDLINDLADPYNKVKGETPSWLKDYFGYFDIWGLKDSGRDTLGSGPAIITNNIAAGKAGYQRGGGGRFGGVPPFQDFRGRTVFRHMQRFLPDDDEHVYEDLRAQIEFGYLSDRYFLEEYYKRLFDVGLDQETLAYVIRQKQNWAYSIWTEANLQNWYTDTQWLPRFDYYRLGDSLLNQWFSYSQHSGVDYANVHTASEVNNPHIFAFMPYDPISNTSGVWSSGRGFTNHELDLKLNVGDVIRLVPYVQGQAIGWTNQINGREMGRLWGAAGLRAEAMAWKAYPLAESEYFNVHGLNHKINIEADYRNAWANTRLDQIGVQDDLDDNTYESTRRYFALTNYAGGVLPQQYDPRHLILRRALSPITGPADILGSMETLHLGLHQRLQTKRGPEGKRRIIDWMTFDLDTTYYPYASRDNFGKPFGQNMYNWQWFIGDRTSIMSYGWFEFWKLNGNPIYNTNIDRHNDPFGLSMITTGISLSRPPRANIFVGYSIVDTGPINTSALTTSVSYWMSPKWYGSYSTMYDFGNAILLSATFSLTRVGADYLTSVGLNVDPQRQSYMFAFVISPRLSPNIKLGNGVGLGGFDARYAPTQ